MSDDFLRAHEGFTKDAEGGYVWDPVDPGGETNLGVTARVWRSWCQQRGLPVKPMRSLTHADVLPLYREHYWKPLAGQHTWPVSAALYDASVNSGPGDGNPFDERGQEAGATWMMYRARQLRPSGTALDLALAVCDARAEYYEAIIRNRPASAKFRTGWFKRLDRLRAWLKANAASQGTHACDGKCDHYRVFLYDRDKKQYVLWDWAAGDVYGQMKLDKGLFDRLSAMYKRGTKTVHGGVQLEVAADGAFLLKKN